MGILEKTRALLVSRLGPRIQDAGADAKALRELIVDLERARADIVRGLERLRGDEEWLATSVLTRENKAQLAKVRADMAEGLAELARVAAGIDEAKAALAAASGKPRTA